MRKRYRCSEKDCNTRAVARGWCAMHYQRWKLWGDPSAASRKIAMLALSTLIVACAEAPERAAVIEPVACAVPEGMVLMPIDVREQAMQGIKELDEALDACAKAFNHCRVRSNCS